MNTNALAKHYGALTPRERLPLIAAASARGDDTERERLSRSAPTKCYRLPDYHGLAEGIQTLVLCHLLEMSSLAALYWRVSAAQADQEQFGGKAGKAPAKRLDGTRRMYAYLLTAHADGWKRFCEEMRLDGDLMLKFLPEYETVCEDEETARAAAFTREEATAWLRKAGDGTEEVISAGSVAASMRALVSYKEEWWGE